MSEAQVSDRVTAAASDTGGVIYVLSDDEGNGGFSFPLDGCSPEGLRATAEQVRQALLSAYRAGRAAASPTEK